MKIRLALTLDIGRDKADDDEMALTSETERSHGIPPIGFKPNTLDPEEGHK